MSEEQKQEKETSCSKAIILLTIISLFFSVAALAMSIYSISSGGNTNASAGGEKKVVISKQYDRGRSLQKAQNTNKPIIVFFYTDWCGFCQRFAPTFDKITKKPAIKKNFAIAFVNCEKEENQKIMEEYNVQGFPTVFVIKEDGSKEQLPNEIFFNDDSVKIIKEKMFEIIED